MISRKRLAFEASIQNKNGDKKRGQMLDQGTSCRGKKKKKRCKTSIADADKTVLAFDICIKKPRHDTVMCQEPVG